MPKLKAEKKSRQHTAVAKQGMVQLVLRVVDNFKVMN
jgi:hypothetical protein